MATNRARFLICLIATSLVVSLAFAGAATAQRDTNRGTVKIHDEMDVDPDPRNQPHVSCDFWVEGFNFNDPTGRLEFRAWPPTGNKTVVVPDGDDLNWTGEPDGDGEYDFLKGEYFLEPGHYQLRVYTYDDHPGHNKGHFAKSKLFWVDECEDERVPCPPDVTAHATTEEGEPVVHLSWGDVTGADSYNVYRAIEGGDLELIFSTNETSFTDTNVEVGVTYDYMVTAVIGEEESEQCERISVTAIPFFPSLVVGALAVLGSVGAFAVLRRKN